MNNAYDTFISYRRQGGQNIAARLYDNLLFKKYNPFYDVTGMESGRFDEQLRIRVINALNFILVLSEGALDRCENEDDWVRAEISFAIKANLNIVLFADERFVFPSSLPQCLKDVKYYQQVVFNDGNFKDKAEALERMLIKRAQSVFDNTLMPKTDKKLSLTGEYVSYYEDDEDGKTVVRRAPAVINQRFNRIKGFTSFGSKQRWKLSGKIYGKKRLMGMYYANSIFDDGVGTFFLEIKSNSLLEGFWTGYDNVNAKITSGRYLFKRKFTDYTITEMSKHDYQAISALADKALGKDYVTAKTLSNAIAANATLKCITVKNNSNDEIIAFIIYDVIDKNELDAILRDCAKDKLAFADKIGYLKTIAVKEEYQGYGIACELVKRVNAEFASLDVDVCVSTAWKHNGIINIGNVLEVNGYSKLCEIPDYWYDDSIANNYQCPACGNPCRCSCVIYCK